MDIFRRYDPTMCAAGCDEGYLKYIWYCLNRPIYSSAHSITRYCEEHELQADECVRQMRETVAKETKLTVSAGIAPNKVRIVGPTHVC